MIALSRELRIETKREQSDEYNIKRMHKYKHIFSTKT